MSIKQWTLTHCGFDHRWDVNCHPLPPGNTHFVNDIPVGQVSPTSHGSSWSMFFFPGNAGPLFGAARISDSDLRELKTPKVQETFNAGPRSRRSKQVLPDSPMFHDVSRSYILHHPSRFYPGDHIWKAPTLKVAESHTGHALSASQDCDLSANCGGRLNEMTLSENGPNMAMIITWLVVWTPLKNRKVNWDDDIPNIWENKKCSKPPTSYDNHSSF